MGGGGFGGFSGRGGAGRLRAGNIGGGSAGGVQLFGSGAVLAAASLPAVPADLPQPAAPGGVPAGGPPGFPGGAGGSGSGGGPGAPGALGAGGGGGGIGAPIGNSASLSKVLSYVKQHGGGTIAVSSQSSAAQAIIDGDANVAGIGGFSGRESDVSVAWLAQEVSARANPLGARRTGRRPGRPAPGRRHAHRLEDGDGGGRQGVHGGEALDNERVGGKLYDCQGRAAALLSAGAQQSAS